MKSKHRYLIAFLVLIANVVAIYAWRSQKANQMAAPVDDRMVSVSTALSELGARRGCFFTIEEAWKNDGVMNRIESQRISPLAGGRNVLDDMNELQRLVPGVTYKVDGNNPKIIHIMDASLAQQKNYALDSVIPKIDFSGTVFDLVKELERLGMKVSANSTMDVHDFGTMDFKTEVHVKGEALSVRKALTDFIPLKDRTNRILWVARTKVGGVSFVRFALGSVPTSSPAD